MFKILHELCPKVVRGVKTDVTASGPARAIFQSARRPRSDELSQERDHAPSVVDRTPETQSSILFHSNTPTPINLIKIEFNDRTVSIPVN